MPEIARNEIKETKECSIKAMNVNFQTEEKELWDNLSDLADRAVSNVEKVINV